MNTALVKATSNAIVKQALANSTSAATRQLVRQAALKGAKAGAKKALQAARNVRAKPRRNNIRVSSYRTRRNTAPVSFANGFGATTKPIRIHQTELIGDIVTAPKDKAWYEFWKSNSPQQFHIQQYAINPAHPDTFPWLSNIAKLFDKYKFHSLKFTFTNQVATTRDGKVAFAVDYDTLDAEPQNLTALSQLSKFDAIPPFTKYTFTIPVNHPGLQSWLYTYDAKSKDNDLKTYNLGTFYVANQDCAKISGSIGDAGNYSQVLGQLSVEYDVSLMDKNYVSPTAKVSGLDPQDPIIQEVYDKYMGTYQDSSASHAIVADGNLVLDTDASTTTSNVYKSTVELPVGSKLTVFIMNQNAGATPAVPGVSGDIFDAATRTIALSASNERIEQLVLDNSVPIGSTLIYSKNASDSQRVLIVISPP